jgi:hypothetical protein
MTYDIRGHAEPSFDLINPDLRQFLRLYFNRGLSGDIAWSCNLCAAHFGDYVNRSKVYRHARKA